jgi:hypothetical protein
MVNRSTKSWAKDQQNKSTTKSGILARQRRLAIWRGSSFCYASDITDWTETVWIFNSDWKLISFGEKKIQWILASVRRTVCWSSVDSTYTHFILKIFLWPKTSFLLYNTQTMHIKSFYTQQPFYVTLKPYTMAGFKPGSSCSWGGCDAHCATPPGLYIHSLKRTNCWDSE